jgi:hypothetical protein
MGAWFEAMIVKVVKEAGRNSNGGNQDTKTDSENMETEITSNTKKDETVDENCNMKLTENKELKNATSALMEKQNKETLNDIEMKESTSNIGCDVTDGDLKPKVTATILDDEDTVKDDGYKYYIKFEG